MTTATKFRLRFAKRGDLRLVSHHDLMRCLERMSRRAAVPLATTQGFTPRPKVVFALALGLGIEALDEAVDMELSEPMAPDDLLRRLSAVAPAGFDWLDAKVLPEGAPAPRPAAVEYRMVVPADRREPARSALAVLLASSQWSLTRRRPDRGRETTIELRSFVLDAELRDDGVLRFRLKISPEGSARAEEFLEALGLRELLDRGAVLTRARVELDP